MKAKILKLSLGLLAGSSLSACGFGVTNSNTAVSSSHTITAQFVDSAVENLQYESHSHSGITDSQGRFQCNLSEEVSFFIGPLNLGSSICQRIITPQTIAAVIQQTQVPQTTTSASGITTNNGSQTVTQVISTASANAPEVINRVRLLLSLDSDSNPANGIQLPSGVDQLKIPTLSIDFTNTSSFDNSAPALLQALPAYANRSIASYNSAQTHFAATMARIPAMQATPGQQPGSSAITIGPYYDEHNGFFDENGLENSHSEFDQEHEGHD